MGDSADTNTDPFGLAGRELQRGAGRKEQKLEERRREEEERAQKAKRLELNPEVRGEQEQEQSSAGAGRLSAAWLRKALEVKIY